MPDKLTDKEIVKALECCTKSLQQICIGCPLYEKLCTKVDLKSLALDLINRLQAENGIYETCNARKDEAIKHLESEVKRLQAENKRLKAPTTDWLVRGISKEQLQEEKIQAFTEEINRLQAENERLQLLFESVINSRDGYIKVIEQYKAENERLKNAYKQCAFERDAYIEIENTAIAEAKAEAYKECIEKAKSEIDRQSHSRSLEASGERFRIHKILDNLSKELVGEDDASKN